VPKQYLKGQDVLDDGSARYMASFVDLNDDGKKEVIVHVISESLCGTESCPRLVLVPTQSSFSIVSRISITRPAIRSLNANSYGWHDLAVWAGGGIQPGYEADVPFDGELRHKSDCASCTRAQFAVSRARCHIGQRRYHPSRLR